MDMVLKARHSLIGISLVPVVIRLKASDWNAEDLMLARWAKYYNACIITVHDIH